MSIAQLSATGGQWGLNEHSGWTRINLLRMSEFIRNVGVSVMSEVQVREMQRQIAKLTESITIMAGEKRSLTIGKPPVYIAKLLDTSVPMLERVYTKDDAATLEALVE